MASIIIDPFRHDFVEAFIACALHVHFQDLSAQYSQPDIPCIVYPSILVIKRNYAFRKTNGMLRTLLDTRSLLFHEWLHCLDCAGDLGEATRIPQLARPILFAL